MVSMDVPTMSDTTFRRIEQTVLEAGKDLLAESMEAAAQEEREAAIEHGQIDKDGHIWIRVYVDGGWSKRSYGHSYDAKSGTAVVIGYFTGKLLYLEVRNKYCSICAVAQNAAKKPKQHKCFKNWPGSFGAMEASILGEAFNHAQKAYGIIYKEFVADGDSSEFAKIRKECSYGDKVDKVECKNHAIKNYGKALYGLKQRGSTAKPPAKQALTVAYIKELQNAAQSALYMNANGDVQQLKKDLKNGPNQVFGKYQNCATFCDKAGITKQSKWIQIQSS